VFSKGKFGIEEEYAEPVAFIEPSGSVRAGTCLGIMFLPPAPRPGDGD